MRKLTYHEGQYPDGSACFFILEQPDPGMTYEGIPQEPRVIATVTTEKMAILFCAAPELLAALKGLVQEETIEWNRPALKAVSTRRLNAAAAAIAKAEGG